MSDQTSIEKSAPLKEEISAQTRDLNDVDLGQEAVSWYLVMLVLWSGLGAFSFGFASSTVGFVLADPDFIRITDWPSHLGLQGAIISLFHVGGFVGLIAVAYIAQHYGRKPVFLWCCLWTMAGTAIEAGGQNMGMVIAGRFITGVGAWTFVYASELYQNEISPAARRGALGMLTGVLLGTGYVVASWIGVGFSYLSTAGNTGMTWRGLVILQLVGPLIVLLALPLVPESPRWLVQQGRKEEALTVLLKIHRSPLDPDSLFARAEHYQIVKQIELENTLISTWWSLFTTYRKMTVIASIVAIGYLGNGAFFIAAYGPQLYASLGYDYHQSIIYQAGWLTMILTSFLLIPFMDKLGRRFFLIFGLGGCTLCLIIETILVAQFGGGGPSISPAGKSAAVAVLYLFIFFDAFIEPTVWLYTCEAFPSHIRAKGYAFSLIVVTIMNTWVNESSGAAIANLGYKAYFVYIILSFLGTVAFYLWVPETMNVPLEEIAALFGKDNQVAVRHTDVLRAREFEKEDDGSVEDA